MPTNPTNAGATNRPTKPAASSTPAGVDCSTCPSFLKNMNQTSITGRNIGGAVCGIKLIPLNRPGGPEKKTFEHFARGCKSYGQEVTPDPAARNKPHLYQIAFPSPPPPMPALHGMGDTRVRSCNSCQNYVPPMAVRKATGWSAGFCRAKGALVLDDRLSEYAVGCEDKRWAEPADRLQDNGHAPAVEIYLMPEYSLDFGKPKKLDIDAIHKVNIAIKPLDYESDAPVTDAMKLQGIKALRRIQDPKGYGKNVFLPIMDPYALDKAGKRIFSDEDIERIPKSGDVPERPERYYDHDGLAYKLAVMWTKLKQTPALWGIAGSGKTELFRHMAWMMSMPFQRISITESSELDDLAGKMMYTPEKGTFYQYGRVPRAWQRPNVLCLDEPNTGPPAVWQFLRPLTDDSKQLVIDQNNGERILPHRLSYLGLAMNPDWDPRNVGAAPLADADGSRLMHVWLGLPPEKIEKQIIVEHMELNGWDTAEAKATVDTLMKIATEIRGLSELGTLPLTWGIRNQKKVALAKAYMGWKDAFRIGVTNALEPQQGELILNIVDSYTDEEDV